MTAALSIDPRAFRPEAITQETREFNEQLRKQIAAAPNPYEQTPAEIRAIRAASGRTSLGELVRVDWGQDRTIPGPAGEIPVRVFVPDAVRAVYLHFHGGGHVLGGQHEQDPALADIATTLQVAVVSVGYRLAPEHKYPAGPDDCEAAALWLAKRAASEFGSDRLLVGGESAGATLSVATLLRMRDHHGFTGFRGAKLHYGCYDFSWSPSAARCGEDSLILNKPFMNWLVDHYFPSGLDRREPELSTLYADLSDMPPALFTVGTLDPLLDDSLFMYGRWVAAGNEAELAVYPGGVHGFDFFPIAIARQATSRAHQFMRRVVEDSD